MEKILKNERTNEKTNEWTNKRTSERMEQKFMNEISSTAQEIEESPFFRHDNRLFRQFLENIEDCYQQYFMWKKQKYHNFKNQGKSWKMAISCIFPFFRGRKKFSSEIGLGHILSANTHLWAKNQEKLTMKSRENAKKTVFPAYFRHFRPEKNVFRKSGSITFWTLSFCIFVPKIRKN